MFLSLFSQDFLWRPFFLHTLIEFSFLGFLFYIVLFSVKISDHVTTIFTKVFI